MIHLIHVHLENVKLDIQIIHQLNTMLDGSWMLKSTDIEPPLLGKIVFAISRIDGINFDFSDVFKWHFIFRSQISLTRILKPICNLQVL